MATSCDGNRTELTCEDGMFVYSMQIVGEDRHVKPMDRNGLIIIEDVDCYSIRLRHRRIVEPFEGRAEDLPCAKVSIDGKFVGLFVMKEPTLEIDRFPSNGDVMCFVPCKLEEARCGGGWSARQNPLRDSNAPLAFGNVSSQNMGLINVTFGICHENFPDNDQNAYFVLDRYIPEPCRISSRDVKPLLSSLDLRSRKRGYDEVDCGAERTQTIEGGTLRFGNDNTRKIAAHQFQQSAVTQFDTSCITVRLVGTLAARKCPVSGKVLVAKGIDGNILDTSTYQLPPKADVTFQ